MGQISEIFNVVRESSGTIGTTPQSSEVFNVVRETSGTIAPILQKSEIFNVVREVSASIAYAPSPTFPSYVLCCVNG